MSITVGVVLWSLASIALAGREIWDVGRYWTVWLPAAYLLSLVLGFAFPERSWRWPMAVMLVQLPVMAFVSGEVGSLAPLGAIMLLVLSIPGIALAPLGAAMRRRLAA